VGVELLGEIKHRYPQKVVTLVHSRAELISGSKLKPEFKQRVLERVRAIPEVKVITEDRVIVEDELKGRLRFVTGKRTMKTEKGESIETDLVFLCTGGSPTTSFLSKTFPDKVTEKGDIRVNKFLQVEGLENIFAAGDCAQVESDNKQGLAAHDQGGAVVGNIKNLLAKRPLKEYGGSFIHMFVPFGP